MWKPSKIFSTILPFPLWCCWGVEFIITLVCFLRRLRREGDSRRLLLVGMVLQLLAVLVVLQNALFLPRFLPDLLQRYLGILPFIVAGLYFAPDPGSQPAQQKIRPGSLCFGGRFLPVYFGILLERLTCCCRHLSKI